MKSDMAPFESFSFLQIRGKDLQIQQLEDEADGLTRNVAENEKRLSKYASQEEDLDRVTSHREALAKDLEEAKNQIRALQASLETPNGSSSSALSQSQPARSGVFVARVSPSRSVDTDKEKTTSSVPVRPYSERRAQSQQNRHTVATDATVTTRRPLGGHRSVSSSNMPTTSSISSIPKRASSSDLAQRRYGR